MIAGRGWAAFKGSRHGAGSGLRRRAELQNAKAHAPDHSAVLIGELVAVVEKVAGAERRALLLGDLLEEHLLGDEVAGTQVAQILLLKIRRYHRSEAGRVQFGDAEQSADRGRILTGEAAHGPHLEHRRWGDDAAVLGALRKAFIEIERVALAHRLAPAADHRQIDGIGCRARWRGGRAALRAQLRKPCGHSFRHAHRGAGARGSPRPICATMSRSTSVAPPPKVLI